MVRVRLMGVIFPHGSVNKKSIEIVSEPSVKRSARAFIVKLIVESPGKNVTLDGITE